MDPDELLTLTLNVCKSGLPIKTFYFESEEVFSRFFPLYLIVDLLDISLHSGISPFFIGHTTGDGLTEIFRQLWDRWLQMMKATDSRVSRFYFWRHHQGKMLICSLLHKRHTTNDLPISQVAL